MRDTLDSLSSATPYRETLRHPSRDPEARSRILIAVLAASLVAMVLGAFVLVGAYPLTQANVIQQLEQATGSTVRFGSFRRTYFPHFGCIAEKVILRRTAAGNNSTLLSVESLIIEANPARLFSKHLSLIRLEGAHAVFAPLGTGPDWQPTPSTVVVDEFEATDALLEFTRHDSRIPPVSFNIHQFLGHHLATPDPMRFELQIQNPTPPGEVHVTGSFGPWNKNQLAETPIAGKYSFRRADLGVFQAIQGTLSSDGRFEGPLDNIQIEGTTTTPEFSLKNATHQLPLTSAFHAQVDATNGDVTLDRLRAQLMQTVIFSRGVIAQRRTEDGKTAAINFAIRSGRIQDLLFLFVAENQAPLNGTFNLNATAVIPPDGQPFLKKLQMSGDFSVDSALFTQAQTQQSVEKLSALGRGDARQADAPDRVVTGLQGHAVVKNGVATFSDLHFRVPGARAKLHGTYDLISHRINLHGTLFMDAQLPKATSGVKSFLLKAINPLLKKNRRGGAEFPVSITGTYESPSYSADPV
jgi:AsmA-like C-terminal region